MIVRDYVIRVRMTKGEYEFLCQKAEVDKDTKCRNGKKNLSAYIRKCALRESGYRSDIKKEINDLTYQVRKIGVNINQAVKKINTGYYNADTCAELLNGLEEIEQKFSELLDRLENQNGYNKTDEY